MIILETYIMQHFLISYELFLKRNPDLNVRKAEGVSLARCQGMNKTEVTSYFNLLETTLEAAGIKNKPSHIFNMDESGMLQCGGLLYTTGLYLKERIKKQNLKTVCRQDLLSS